MIIDVWKSLTIVMSAVLIITLITPVITGLFTFTPATSFSDELNCEQGKCVELFVMSHCPYGTQAEKGVLPAVQALGDDIDFKLRFVYYAMHGKTELDEQLNQYCIQYQQPSKFIDYLYCFLDEGDGEGCLNEVGVNTQLLSSCVEQSDEAFNVTALFNDRSSWLSGYYPRFNVHLSLNEQYGVRGSPTLVVNGQQVQPSSRSPQGFLDAICNALGTNPSGCDESLSTTAPSSGFGFSGTGSASTATCG
ncbi:hypothetical protein GF352_03200 [archaeon]|nr:hypothetical protein [archaeon]